MSKGSWPLDMGKEKALQIGHYTHSKAFRWGYPPEFDARRPWLLLLLRAGTFYSGKD